MTVDVDGVIGTVSGALTSDVAVFAVRMVQTAAQASPVPGPAELMAAIAALQNMLRESNIREVRSKLWCQ